MIELERGEMERFANYDKGYNGRGKKSFRITFASWDKLSLVFVVVFLLSALAALFVLLTPVLDFILDFTGLHYAGWNEWEAWMSAGDRGFIVGVVLGLIALLFALLARYRVLRNFSVYAEAGCPQCHEHELIRVRRNRPDRALGFLGVPIRRYSCRNCTWHGVRLAGYRYSKKAVKIKDVDDDAFEYENVEVDAFDDIMVGAFEFEDGHFETQMEPIDEAAPVVEMVTAPIGAVEVMAAEEISEDIVAIDLIEPAEQPGAAESIVEESLVKASI